MGTLYNRLEHIQQHILSLPVVDRVVAVVVVVVELAVF
jgi:hypothetical protein